MKLLSYNVDAGTVSFCVENFSKHEVIDYDDDEDQSLDNDLHEINKILLTNKTILVFKSENENSTNFINLIIIKIIK